MKRIVACLAASSLFGSALAQEKPSLNVMVESLDEDAKVCGIDRTTLESVATTTLRSSGIQVVFTANPSLYIRFTFMAIRFVSDKTVSNCVVHLRVAVKGFTAGTQEPLNGFNPKGPVTVTLCESGSMLLSPTATMDADVSRELEKRIKVCVGSLDY